MVSIIKKKPETTSVGEDVENLEPLCTAQENSMADPQKLNIELSYGDFPGGAVVKTPHSQCRGPGFDPWSRN